MRHQRPSKKTSTNLSINAALVEEAKALGLNLSELAEASSAHAVRRENSKRWKRHNAVAIQSHNDCSEKRTSAGKISDVLTAALSDLPGREPRVQITAALDMLFLGL
jgi:antitoxin CcdA